MLVANLNGHRIEATEADKGHEYHCPECQSVVVLKKGRIVTHHFAHKPPTDCRWAKGETREHLAAKQLFKEEFVGRGLRAEVEHEVKSLPNDRRADVMVWSPNGTPFALELQHTPIGYDDLENRTRSYIRAGVRVIWIPFIRSILWEDAEVPQSDADGDFIIERFSARPLERWVNGFNYGRFWMYDPSDSALWEANLSTHNIHVPETSWYDSEGNENYAGGYSKPSRRWRKLKLWGPYSLNQVKIGTMKRLEMKMGNHQYPGGKVGKFVVAD